MLDAKSRQILLQHGDSRRRADLRQEAQDRMTRPATPHGALLIALPAARRGQATFAFAFLICESKPTKSHSVNGLLTVDP